VDHRAGQGLIIRGGHNIDPAEIEDALLKHEAVAFAGAIGQPDAFAGELPCVYVELVAGKTVAIKDLLAFAADHIHERAAIPKHVEIMPNCRKPRWARSSSPTCAACAITRVYNEALAKAGLAAEVVEVVEDKKRGLVARVRRTGAVDEALPRDPADRDQLSTRSTRACPLAMSPAPAPMPPRSPGPTCSATT
jgi:fatty-acyl-CoA synthase